MVRASLLAGGMEEGWRCSSASDTVLCPCWHVALHPVPLSWDSGCSMSHWPKAVSNPIPHQAAHAVLAPLRAGREAAAGLEGWCRVPWALRPGPLSERARLSPAENMTSAGASTRGETFLSCVDRSRTRHLGLERALGCGREPCVPKALSAEQGDGPWCILTTLQTLQTGG